MVRFVKFFAYSLATACGGFWVLFGSVEFIQNPVSARGLIIGGFFGIPILFSSFIAFRWLLPGSVFLILHSVFSSWIISLIHLPLIIRVFLAATLTLPSLLAGMILFAIWYPQDE